MVLFQFPRLDSINAAKTTIFLLKIRRETPRNRRDSLEISIDSLEISIDLLEFSIDSLEFSIDLLEISSKSRLFRGESHLILLIFLKEQGALTAVIRGSE